MEMVLQKYIAGSGYCSRRQAEKLIREGAVKINGKIAELGRRVKENDVVSIGKKILSSKTENIYIKLNKPKEYVCTSRNFKGEKNIYSLIKIKDDVRLFVIGRLDKDSRGLVILTNDGELTQKISHPKYESEKEYITTVKTKDETTITEEMASVFCEKLKNGINIGEEDGVVWAKRVKYMGKNVFSLTLTQGKKRQIRRMFGYLKLAVVDLVRTDISGVGLGSLAEGKWEYLSEEEMKRLMK
jgi:pseudouridine synthase